MQESRGDDPGSAGLQAVGPRQIEDAVVALIPALEAAVDVARCRARLQPEEGIGKPVGAGVELRREVVRFRLVLVSHEAGMLLLLVQGQGGRSHVVEELTERRPPTPGMHPPLAYQRGTGVGDSIAEQKSP